MPELKPTGDAELDTALAEFAAHRRGPLPPRLENWARTAAVSKLITGFETALDWSRTTYAPANSAVSVLATAWVLRHERASDGFLMSLVGRDLASAMGYVAQARTPRLRDADRERHERADRWRCELYAQIVGKVRLALSPLMNEWWQVPFYLTARGLSTSPMCHGERSFDLEFDFIDHRLVIRASDGQLHALRLAPRAVADFYQEVMSTLASMGLEVDISDKPVEVPHPVRFRADRLHAAYDAEYARRHWEVLRRLDPIFKSFRARFTGKASPVHFFWGSFDLAVSRFSGRPAPPRPGADRITRLAYDEEVSSLGFWSGGQGVDGPALYAYFSPEPTGFSEQRVQPAEAFYSVDLHKFVLPYDVVRRAREPEQVVLAFAQSTYEAGAALAGWNRAALERPIARLLAA